MIFKQIDGYIAVLKKHMLYTNHKKSSNEWVMHFIQIFKNEFLNPNEIK